MSKYLVSIDAIMDGVGQIGPKDQVFLLVKRMTSAGEAMSREQYPANRVESQELTEGELPDPELDS